MPDCSRAASKVNLSLAAVGVERELPLAELRRNRGERLLEYHRELRLPSFFMSAAFSSTTISSPWFTTPIRSAISSASSM